MLLPLLHSHLINNCTSGRFTAHNRRKFYPFWIGNNYKKMFLPFAPFLTRRLVPPISDLFGNWTNIWKPFLLDFQVSDLLVECLPFSVANVRVSLDANCFGNRNKWCPITNWLEEYSTKDFGAWGRSALRIGGFSYYILSEISLWLTIVFDT